jgi:hypothetical protein
MTEVKPRKQHPLIPTPYQQAYQTLPQAAI